MGIEQLVPEARAIHKRRVPFIPLIPRQISQNSQSTLPVSQVDIGQMPFKLKPLPDIKKAQEAWRKKCEPEWKRKVELVEWATDNNLLVKLSKIQQEAIAAVVPERGGHKSISEAAEELHKTPPAVRSAFNNGMKQLESKKTTGKFLKQGGPRKRWEISEALKRKRRERKIVMEAIKTGIFFKLRSSHQIALRAKCLGEKGLLDEHPSRQQISLISQQKRDGLRNLLKPENSKPIQVGGSTSARARELPFRQLIEGGIIEIKRKRRQTKSRVAGEEVIKRIEDLASQGKNVSQITAVLSRITPDENKYTWYLVSQIALQHNIAIKKSNTGPHAKAHQSSFAS